MGYLNNASVTVDAILTTKGRELLSQGGNTNGLDIKYFALGDDEVNYDLWNPANPLGSDYYGIIIENMPVLEASPIPEQNLKSKLLTLAKDTKTLASITNIPPAILNNSGNKQFTLTPGVSNGANNNTLGYNVSYDNRYLTLKSPPTPASSKQTIVGSAIGDSQVSISNPNITTVTGISFVFSVKDVAYTSTTTVNTQIIVEGNEVGGRSSVPVTITYTVATQGA
jgi:hypothetical protein